MSIHLCHPFIQSKRIGIVVITVRIASSNKIGLVQQEYRVKPVPFAALNKLIWI